MGRRANAEHGMCGSRTKEKEDKEQKDSEGKTEEQLGEDEDCFRLISEGGRVRWREHKATLEGSFLVDMLLRFMETTGDPNPNARNYMVYYRKRLLDEEEDLEPWRKQKGNTDFQMTPRSVMEHVNWTKEQWGDHGGQLKVRDTWGNIMWTKVKTRIPDGWTVEDVVRRVEGKMERQRSQGSVRRDTRGQDQKKWEV